MIKLRDIDQDVGGILQELEGRFYLLFILGLSLRSVFGIRVGNFHFSFLFGFGLLAKVSISCRSVVCLIIQSWVIASLPSWLQGLCFDVTVDRSCSCVGS